jgi:flagellar motor component MotA
MGEKMTAEQFREEYKRIVARALSMLETGRREGLLALEDEVDENKILQRDVFEVGIRLVVDGNAKEFIDKILTNLVNHESDTQRRLLLTIGKEAVLAILEGWYPSLLELLLNSYVNIEVEETMKRFCDR